MRRQSTEQHPLACEVQYFFRINPDEELTAQDCGAKFDIHEKTAACILTRMRAAGMLSSRTEGRSVVYMRGGV